MPKYQFFCTTCSYKRFSDGTDVKDLVMLKSSPIPAGSPYIDPLTKKIVTPKPISPLKKFKCPKCGNIIKPKILEEIKNADVKNNVNGSETSTEGPQI